MPCLRFPCRNLQKFYHLARNLSSSRLLFLLLLLGQTGSAQVHPLTQRLVVCRLLEIVQNPADIEPHDCSALQALVLIIEEEDQAREEAAGPVVRDNIPNLERPVFVRASDTDPKIMTPTAMLKATATNRTPPKLPRPSPQPLGTPEFQQEFENIIEASLQPYTEPPAPSTPKVELPAGLQDDLEQIIEDNTPYKHSPTATAQELHPQILVRKYNSPSPPTDTAAASSAEMAAGLAPAAALAAAVLPLLPLSTSSPPLNLFHTTYFLT